MIDLWADDGEPEPSCVNVVCRIDGTDVQCRVLYHERALEILPRESVPATIEFDGHQCDVRSTMMRNNSMLLLFGEREFCPFAAVWWNEWRRLSEEVPARS